VEKKGGSENKEVVGAFNRQTTDADCPNRWSRFDGGWVCDDDDSDKMGRRHCGIELSHQL
jgi:hypothetical protein